MNKWTHSHLCFLTLFVCQAVFVCSTIAKDVENAIIAMSEQELVGAATRGDVRCMLLLAIRADLNFDIARKNNQANPEKERYASEMRKWYAMAAAFGNKMAQEKIIDFLWVEKNTIHDNVFDAVISYASSAHLSSAVAPLLIAS